MRPAIGILQGRLSPPQGSGAQFFPRDWAAEFPLAKEMGFSSITWFLDRTVPGFDPIRDIWLTTGVLAAIDGARRILPIQAIDCSHLYPFFGSGAGETVRAFELLLPPLAPRLSGAIILPMLLHNAPRTDEEMLQTRRTLERLLAVAEPLGARFALETEMPAAVLAEFVDSFNSPLLGVCYDLGSATTYGLDSPAEILELGSRIFEVHIKDHKRGQVVGTHPSVKLGEGDTDFIGCFKALKTLHYKGGLTMQAWRGSEYLADAGAQLSFINKKLDDVYGH